MKTRLEAPVPLKAVFNALVYQVCVQVGWIAAMIALLGHHGWPALGVFASLTGPVALLARWLKSWTDVDVVKITDRGISTGALLGFFVVWAWRTAVSTGVEGWLEAQHAWWAFWSW